MQTPQAGRIRRADVDSEVVGDGSEQAGRLAVVGHSILDRNDATLSDVGADNRPVRVTALTRHSLGRGRGSPVVEAHAVDDRSVVDEAKESRLRVAVLRDRRHGADLDVTKPQCPQAPDAPRIFIEPGSHAEGRLEAQPERVDGERRVGPREPTHEPREPEGRDCPDHEHGEVMCPLGIHAPQNGAEEELVHDGDYSTSATAAGWARSTRSWVIADSKSSRFSNA